MNEQYTATVPKLLTATQVAECLGLNVVYFRRLVKSNHANLPPYIMVAGYKRWRASDLADFINGQIEEKKEI